MATGKLVKKGTGGKVIGTGKFAKKQPDAKKRTDRYVSNPLLKRA